MDEATKVPLVWPEERIKRPKKGVGVLMPEYSISEKVRFAIARNLQRAKVTRSSRSRTETIFVNSLSELLTEKVSMDRYKERLSFLLYAQEIHQSAEKAAIVTDSAKVYTNKLLQAHGLFAVDVPGLAKGEVSLMENETVSFKFGPCSPLAGWTSVAVYVVDSDTAYFRSHKTVKAVFEGVASRSGRQTVSGCSIRFDANPFDLAIKHRAVCILSQAAIRQRLFPSRVQNTLSPSTRDIVFFNQSIGANPEQAQAVRNIAGGSSCPAPYILFGPPGTGKTMTLVEAILQVHKRPGTKILVTAPTNSVCDLIAEKIESNLDKNEDIVRFVSNRHWEAMTGSPRKDMSLPHHLARKRKERRKKTNKKWPIQHLVPPDEKINASDVMSYRIVVVTLVTAGKLLTAGVPVGHFTDAFIDEAGQATEPESCIPIGLLNGKGRLVLSGDPYQLPPVVKSPIAERHGLGVSLLERLMKEQHVYRKNQSTGKHIPAFITKLVRNYRSCAELIVTPSKMFYNGELEAHADKSNLLSLKGLTWLPRQYPLLVHNVQHPNTRGDGNSNSKSLWNEKEVHAVVRFVKQLKAHLALSEIGVVTPYRLQAEKIKEALGAKTVKHLEVDVTERFQGQERQVMIVSTVRSGLAERQRGSKSKFDFLGSPKRFNVAVTRAKSLLIIVGDAGLLRTKTKSWGPIIKQAEKNGADRRKHMCMANMLATMAREVEE